VWLAPAETRPVVGGEEAVRKAATLPERFERGAPRGHDLAPEEGCQAEQRNPPGQALGRLSEQLGRGRAEEQESARPPILVDEHAQGLHQTRRTLHLVQAHQLARVPPQERLGIAQSGEVRGALEVEEERAAARRLAFADPGAGERRLAALPRAEERDDRELPEVAIQQPEETPGDCVHIESLSLNLHQHQPSPALTGGSAAEGSRGMDCFGTAGPTRFGCFCRFHSMLRQRLTWPFQPVLGVSPGCRRASARSGR
jgi:hypothetical protein